MSARRGSTPEAGREAVLASFAGDPRVTLPDATRARFGANGLKVHGKVFAMWVRGDFVVKLPTSSVDEAVAAGRGRRLEMGAGRVMKEWLVVDLPPDTWPTFAKRALELATGGRS